MRRTAAVSFLIHRTCSRPNSEDRRRFPVRKFFLAVLLIVFWEFVGTASAGDMHGFLVRVYAGYLMSEEYDLDSKCFALDLLRKGEYYQEVLNRLPGDTVGKLTKDCEALKAEKSIPSSPEAVAFLRKAADQGDPVAQTNLGFLCYKGDGVPQDFAEAHKWLSRAAERGNATAQYNLGILYLNGHGVPQDHVLAHMWFNLAASRLSPPDVEERERAVKNRDLAASKMTPTQIAEAQKLAREWKPKKEEK